MVWKRIPNGSSGDESKFGGDDLNKISDFFNGVANVDNVDINSATTFRDNKLKLRNPTNTFSYNIRTSEIAADRNITVPNITTTDDTLVTTNAAQTIINKTIDYNTNTLLNLPVNAITASSTTTFTNKTIDAINNVIAQRSFNCIIFKSGTTHYAVKFDGTMVSSGTTAETVIQAALDLGGTIFMAKSIYIMSAGFTGLNITQRYTRLTMDRNAQILCPENYTGYIFKALETDDFILEGGLIAENTNTYPANWTGIILESANGGIVNAIIRDMWLYRPNIGIKLLCSGSAGWVNSCIFTNIYINNPRIGIDFDQAVTFVDNVNGFERNLFQNIVIQCGANTTAGFQNIRAKGHTFMGCTIWDFHLAASNAISASVHSTAKDTTFIGGIIATPASGKLGFVDNGIRTMLQDTVYPNGKYYQTMPSVKKVGAFYGTTQGNGSGMLEGLLNPVLPVGIGFDTTGTFFRYTTAATVDSNTGHRCLNVFTRRIFNPVFRYKFKLSNTTNQRLWIGTSSTGNANLTGDDALNAINGIMLSLRAADTVFQIAHNDGTGATVFDAVSGTPAVTTGVHTFTLIADDTNSKFRYSFDNADFVDITTEIPAQTTNLAMHCMIQTSETVAKSLDVYYMEVEQDR